MVSAESESNESRFLAPIRLAVDAVIGLLSLTAGTVAGAPWPMIAIGTVTSVTFAVLLQALFPPPSISRPTNLQWGILALLAAIAVVACLWRLVNGA